MRSGAGACFPETPSELGQDLPLRVRIVLDGRHDRQLDFTGCSMGLVVQVAQHFPGFVERQDVMPIHAAHRRRTVGAADPVPLELRGILSRYVRTAEVYDGHQTLPADLQEPIVGKQSYRDGVTLDARVAVEQVERCRDEKLPRGSTEQAVDERCPVDNDSPGPHVSERGAVLDHRGGRHPWRRLPLDAFSTDPLARSSSKSSVDMHSRRARSKTVVHRLTAAVKRTVPGGRHAGGSAGRTTAPSTTSEASPIAQRTRRRFAPTATAAVPAGVKALGRWDSESYA